MLSELEINKLESQISNFNIATQARHDALEELTLSYGKLLEDYRTLRSDFEAEKGSDEKYKKLARGQERNPFVLVLIDADGYLFADSLIKGGAEGGMKAANLLDEIIRDRLSHFGREYENCKVMVRAYTNLAGLSRTLARAGLAGYEALSMSPFCSKFTRTHDLFDFVDAGDKESVDNKIRKMFHLFVENNQCKHIFFAACHDTGYLDLLTPYFGKHDKITLVRGSSFSPEFDCLDLNIESLDGLFNDNPLDGLDACLSVKTPATPSQPIAMANGHSGPAPTITPVCTHHLSGACKYGRSCKKSHSDGGASWPVPSTAGGADSPISGISVTSPGHHAVEFPAPCPSTSQVQPFVALPRQSPENINLIPVNKDGHRLDFYPRTRTNEDWIIYTDRVSRQKLCNEYHVKGHCKRGQENCPFDHSPIPNAIKLILRQFAHDYPCGYQGDCRLKDCNSGHICFRRKCGGLNDGNLCKLTHRMHNIDPVVVQWVPAVQDMKTFDPHSFRIMSGPPDDDDDIEEEGPMSRTISEPPQSETGVNLRSYLDPHSSDLD